MKKLLIHIPEAQFIMIRYYGLYATYNHKHKDDVERMLSNKTNRATKLKSYRQQLIETFDTASSLCDCGHYMEFIDYWVPENKRNGVLNYDDH